jgi:hypothetical protein
MFHRESPQDAGKRKKDPSLPVESESNPESSEEANPRPPPKFGFMRWGIAAQRDRAGGVPNDLRALIPKSPPPGEFVSSDPFPPVLEVWFAGCHSDVGGSAVEDSVRYSLADISLRWMVKQVVLSQCGIKFDDEALKLAHIDLPTVMLATPTKPDAEAELEIEAGPALPTPLTSPNLPGEGGSGEHMISKGKDKGGEEQSWSQQDVRADIHDQLKAQPMWWLLEALPIKSTWQDADGTWKSEWG